MLPVTSLPRIGILSLIGAACTIRRKNACKKEEHHAGLAGKGFSRRSVCEAEGVRGEKPPQHVPADCRLCGQGMASEGSPSRVALAGRGACAGSFDTVAERAARIRKRKELFALIDETRVEISPDFPCPAEIVRESRSERERELDERCDSLTFGRAEA